MIKTENRLIQDSFKVNNDLSNYHPSALESENIRSQMFFKWGKAIGHNVYDTNGNKWIDLTSGIFVTNTGHSNARVLNAIKQQIDSGLSFSFMYPTDIRQKFAKTLLDVSPDHFEKVVMLNTGSEATDIAYKLMKHWGAKNNKKYIVSFIGSYHGRVLSSDILSSGRENSTWSGVKDDNVIFLEFPYDQDSVFDPKKLPDPESIAGFILETYQGWSSQFYPQKYINDLYDFAKTNNCLVCFDEIQAGFYRMGKLYGYMTYGDQIKPDIVCLGKAIGSPLPMSAVLSTKELIDGAKKLGGTHSGNPLCCAAGIENINIMSEPEFKEELQLSIATFEKRMDRLTSYCEVDYVNARGMVGAIMIKEKEKADKIVLKMVSKGVLPVHTWSRSIKLGPPLTITVDALNEAFDTIEESIRELR